MLLLLTRSDSVINFIITINRVGCLDVACWVDVSTRIHFQDYLDKINNDLKITSSDDDEGRASSSSPAHPFGERQQTCERNTARGGMCRESAA